MPEISFQICGAGAVRSAAAPTAALRLEISNRPADQRIQTLLLNSQIQIEAPRRRYTPEEQDRLQDLFGGPERWAQTLRPLLWTNLTSAIPGFAGSIGIHLMVPCSFDLQAAAAKYFHALDGGTVSILLLFSGTVFYRTAAGELQAEPIPWNAEARFALPVAVWKEAVDLHHPNTAWLGLRRDNFERLYRFKVRHGLATFDEALERMLQPGMGAGG